MDDVTPSAAALFREVARVRGWPVQQSLCPNVAITGYGATNQDIPCGALLSNATRATATP